MDYMSFRSAVVSMVVVVALSPAADAQTTDPQKHVTPDFTIHVWGLAAGDFETRMIAYASLRERLQYGLPPLQITDDPREIRRAEHALARRIRAARSGGDGAEIFTADIATAFRGALILETRPGVCAAILDDNPGHFSFDINDTYPKRRPLSSVPPGILALLPRLPADIYYRFLGRALILHDTRANVILDRIPNAIRCYDDASADSSKRASKSHAPS